MQQILIRQRFYKLKIWHFPRELWLWIYSILATWLVIHSSVTSHVISLNKIFKMSRGCLLMFSMSCRAAVRLNQCGGRGISTLELHWHGSWSKGMSTFPPFHPFQGFHQVQIGTRLSIFLYYTHIPRKLDLLLIFFFMWCNVPVTLPHGYMPDVMSTHYKPDLIVIRRWVIGLPGPLILFADLREISLHR